MVKQIKGQTDRELDRQKKREPDGWTHMSKA